MFPVRLALLEHHEQGEYEVSKWGRDFVSICQVLLVKTGFFSYSCSLAVGSIDKTPNAANQFQRKRLTASEEVSVCFCSHFE